MGVILIDNPEAEVVVSSAAKKVTFHANVQTKVKVQEPGAVIGTSAAKKGTFHANALREVRINVSDVKKKDTFHATVLKVAEIIVLIANNPDICQEIVQKNEK